MSVLYYSTALGLAQFSRLQSYLPLVITVGILFLSENNVDKVAEIVEFAQLGPPICHPVFELGIPLVKLIIAFMWRIPERTHQYK